VDAVAVEPFGERVEDPVAPGHEREVVAEAAKQGLERMSVCVDASGDDGDVAPVLSLVLRVALGELAGLARGEDESPLDHEGVAAAPPFVGEDELGADHGHAGPSITGPG